MKLLAVIFCMFLSVLTQDDPYIPIVDFADVANSSQMTCMIAGGYNIGWVRAYKPDNLGVFDNNSITNFYTLKATDAYYSQYLKYYISPSPKSNKQGYQQIDETYFGLLNYNVEIGDFYFLITQPEMWWNDNIMNINFIQSMINRAKQYAKTPYIMTSKENWDAITGGWAPSGYLATLWWLSAKGDGMSGETQQNFSDYVPFGPWTGKDDASIKQYGKNENLCGVNVNKNIWTYYRSIRERRSLELRRPGRIPDVI